MSTTSNHSTSANVVPAPVPLTDEQRQLIKATVPVLAEHGLTITRRFYGAMLEDNPALKNVFSHSKQTTGHQADALARAVLAYAEHIDDLTPILPVVERICHKHASLHIVPEQYAIVGQYLLQAITDVLGADVFKGELYDAWATGYWQLAHILIDREAELYKQAGWVGWKEFVVSERVQESDTITSFSFKPKDGSTLPKFKPGQYLGIRRQVPELGRYQARQYSLSDAPSPDHFRISVKREVGIRATQPNSNKADTTDAAHPGWISNLLHDTLQVGDTIELASPFGDFFLDDSTAPVVLISAGVGLTPLLSMLNVLIPGTSRKVSWVQVVRGPHEHPFKAHIAKLHAEHPEQLSTAVFYSNPEAATLGTDYDVAGRLNLDKIDRDVLRLDDPKAEYYVCGPDGFMRDTWQALKARGVESERLHAEVFGGGPLPQ